MYFATHLLPETILVGFGLCPTQPIFIIITKDVFANEKLMQK